MALLCCLLFASGCALFIGSLKEGESLPDGKVLLVGAVALAPPVEQGTISSRRQKSWRRRKLPGLRRTTS